MIVANEAFSLTPNKLVFYTRFDRVNSTGEQMQKKHLPSTKPKLTRQFHGFDISVNARRSLQNKIQWLFHLSKKKDITTYSGKRIHSFRVAFFTFTLPSEQKHPTVEITKDLFNHLLTVFRQRFKMENYVWRLEFQKNGNVHYHLVTDTYIDYFASLKIWNKILETKGYISAYKEKHSKMSLHDYIKAYPIGEHSNFTTVAKRYARGCGSNWEQPNSVDVKSAVSKAKISYYISKYFNKSSKHDVKCNPLDNEINSKSLRLWFCSRSLSAMKSISKYLFEIDYDIKYFAKKFVNQVQVRLKYAFIIFFDIQDSTGFTRSFISQLFKDYSKQQGYIPWDVR